LVISNDKGLRKVSTEETNNEANPVSEELAHITGIRVKGNPFKKEPFQKDAWAAISNT